MKLTSGQWREIEVIPGWLDFQNAQLMYSISNNTELNGKGDILEIGTYFGKSAALLAHTLKDLEAITCIDSFRDFSLSNAPEANFSDQNFYYQALTLKKFSRFYGWATKKSKCHMWIVFPGATNYS